MPTPKTFYYARVNYTSQNLAQQIEAFKADGADDRDIFTEEESEKTMNRETYQMLRNHLLRKDDTIVVMSLDMLGRNKEQIKEELNYFKENHIRVRVLDIPTTSYTPSDGQEWLKDMIITLLIEVLASQAEHERNTIRKRQAEGIAIAKAEGKYKGGKPKKSKRLIASVLIISKDFLSAGIFPQQWTIPAMFVRFTEENSKKSGKPLSDIRFFRGFLDFFDLLQLIGFMQYTS